MEYGFAVVHVPHASAVIPEKYRKTILLDEKQLRREMCRMTDAFCDELYDFAEFPVHIVASHSRFVCDVERFRDDSMEPCAKMGQGLMYTRTAFGRRLRMYDEELRDMIVKEIYDPHHERLTAAVGEALERHGKCLIIDGHSFNSDTLKKPAGFFSRPDFDIGTDSFHTPDGLAAAMCDKVKELGYKPKVDTPYAGAITPMKFYRKDSRVVSVMIETNRKLYLNESDMTKSGGFEKTREVCRELMRCAAEYVRNM